MKVNEMMKDIKEVTKVDQDTGKYMNAQRVGTRISIGLVIIFIGILFIFGGFSLVLWGIGINILMILLIATILYILIKTKVI